MSAHEPSQAGRSPATGQRAVDADTDLVGRRRPCHAAAAVRDRRAVESTQRPLQESDRARAAASTRRRRTRGRSQHACRSRRSSGGRACSRRRFRRRTASGRRAGALQTSIAADADRRRRTTWSHVPQCFGSLWCRRTVPLHMRQTAGQPLESCCPCTSRSRTSGRRARRAAAAAVVVVVASATHAPLQAVRPDCAGGRARAARAHLARSARVAARYRSSSGRWRAATQAPPHTPSSRLEHVGRAVAACRTPDPGRMRGRSVPQLRASVLRLTHLPWQLVVRAGQPQPGFAFLPFLCGSVMHRLARRGSTSRCRRRGPSGSGRSPRASASLGLIVTAPTSATPPARSASRRDIPPARPRAIVSIALPPLGPLMPHAGTSSLALSA